jgi:hypothetical protein
MEEIDLKTEYASAKFIPKLSLQEYFIDFLGGLVPGILFLMGNSFILFPAIFAVNTALHKDPPGSTFLLAITDFLVSIRSTPSAIWIVSFVVIFFLAYTIGHLFYRHDPNKPDRKSFKRLVRRLKLRHDDVGMRKELASDDDDKHCQFPYSYYDIYLEKRGFKYLIPFVVWSEGYDKDIRSKCWINLYKTRLMYYHPDKCGTIIRNEAHVRLASSTWYVSKFLFWFGLIGFLISIGAVFASVDLTRHFDSIRASAFWYAIPLIAPAMVSLFAYYFQWSILNFLHYQRLREILAVLDTYYVAYRQNSELMELPIEDFKKKMEDALIKLKLPLSMNKNHRKKGKVHFDASWK